MAYEIFHSPDNSIVRTEYKGDIKFAEMTDSYLARFSDIERVKQYKVILSDFTQARMTGLSADQVKTLADMSMKAERHNPNVIVVGIMPRDLEYGLTRMWQAYASESVWESRIFRTRAEGEEFVKAILGEQE